MEGGSGGKRKEGGEKLRVEKEEARRSRAAEKKKSESLFSRAQGVIDLKRFSVASLFDSSFLSSHLLSEAGEVGRQDRGGDAVLVVYR